MIDIVELATEGSGFAVDEPVEELGIRWMLPPWLEARRNTITASLKPVKLRGLLAFSPDGKVGSALDLVKGLAGVLDWRWI
ncbi:MAG: hypothetical protein ACK47M_06135 [Caldilinea sp.]